MEYRKTVKVTPDGKREIVDSAIVVEFTVNLYVNNELKFNMVCTPQNIHELAVGRLLTEGVINCYDNIVSAYIDNERNEIFFQIDLDKNSILRKDEQLPDVNYTDEWIFEMINVFAGDSEIHKKTKAAHSCILARHGEILFKCEDIGRHNAIDKAIGYMYINNIDPAECMLFTSGRVPTEIANKVIMAGVPILISKAVPTDKAIDLAKKHNLQLLCKAWPDSYEIFA